MIRVCVAGVSGWTGSEVARAVLASSEFELVGAVARRAAGRDAGELLGVPGTDVTVSATLAEALARPAEVLIDYTAPDTVKARTLEALSRGVDATAEYVRRLAAGIVGFRVEVERWEGKWKLSQNQPAERREKVAAALEGSDDPDARAVARLMRADAGRPA